MTHVPIKMTNTPRSQASVGLQSSGPEDLRDFYVEER